ncbi:MAG: CsiV family protein [Xanthomonadales bacterium]|nr:CsiV family protein [Xanthomonadales bacterium]
MIKAFLFILIIIIVPAAMAQERSAYRIEVLILRHLDTVADPDYIAELPALEQDALDFYANEIEGALAATQLGDPTELAPPDEGLLPPVGPFPQEGPFDDVEWIEVRSERMNTVWRNLRLSESFRPEAFLAWEQPVDPPFPLIRVRNEGVIAVDDPLAALRGLDPPYVFRYDLPSGQFALGGLPDPQLHYALEGTVRLRRSRFLHFDLDLAFRQPAPGAVETARGVTTDTPLRPEYAGFAVHALVQSRQVRTERMEYFDSPILGALLWITEVEYQDEPLPDEGDIAP